MTSEHRVAYDEMSHQAQLRADCEAVSRNLGLDLTPSSRLERAARAAVEGEAPSLHFEDFPREVHKRDITVSDAAARIANALHLHLD
ncbi:hypothetical protein ACFP3Q_15445 [Nocardioides sp. GCM10027113]|uniref:hypothetical protein n=1 Tax=unclassified Nocardioides TaxID=2615069 RepID=UPI0036132A5B